MHGHFRLVALDALIVRTKPRIRWYYGNFTKFGGWEFMLFDVPRTSRANYRRVQEAILVTQWAVTVGANLNYRDQPRASFQYVASSLSMLESMGIQFCRVDSPGWFVCLEKDYPGPRPSQITELMAEIGQRARWLWLSCHRSAVALCDYNYGWCALGVKARKTSLRVFRGLSLIARAAPHLQVHQRKKWKSIRDWGISCDTKLSPP